MCKLILIIYLATMFQLGSDRNKYPRPGQPLDSAGGGCYIATYIYGRDSEEVKLLTEFRDRVLLQLDEGRHFVWTYYMISPELIKWHKRMKEGKEDE